MNSTIVRKNIKGTQGTPRWYGTPISTIKKPNNIEICTYDRSYIIDYSPCIVHFQNGVEYTEEEYNAIQKPKLIAKRFKEANADIDTVIP
jgi:hypothetical protein